MKIPLVGGSNDSGLPPASYDTEGLFPLEGMDDLQISCASDDDLSESEGINNNKLKEYCVQNIIYIFIM